MTLVRNTQSLEGHHPRYVDCRDCHSVMDLSSKSGAEHYLWGWRCVERREL